MIVDERCLDRRERAFGTARSAGAVSCGRTRVRSGRVGCGGVHEVFLQAVGGLCSG